MDYLVIYYLRAPVVLLLGPSLHCTSRVVIKLGSRSIYIYLYLDIEPTSINRLGPDGRWGKRKYLHGTMDRPAVVTRVEPCWFRWHVREIQPLAR
jgi:hypothetical protein